MRTTRSKQLPDLTWPAISNSDQPDFSVCVKSDDGWIFLAEFRTYSEATSLAEATVKRSAVHTCVRRHGEMVAEYEPVDGGS